ncbi:hypothetical protein GALMADRAFT_149001, partial [Galerina marginata CBS 339.88]
MDDIISQIEALPGPDLNSPDDVEAAASAVANTFAGTFERLAVNRSFTSRSTPWWTPECTASLATYRASLADDDWGSFRKLCKETKRKFFDERIAEIAYANKRPWDLMNWVQK